MNLPGLLAFQPIFKPYLWGGRRLATHLAKQIPDGVVAESWELVDRGADQSRVVNGPLAGLTLHELFIDHRKQLLGKHAQWDRFPLLFKFLDAQQPLSVQVHPTDEQGTQLDPPDFGKTEAWIILEALPGSAIFAGLKRGFDRAALAREIARGTAELCLHRFEPRVGDCIFLPAGTVHALGAGLLVAEIQQSSDTTYRLFDWNRLGPDGKPRALHIEQGLAVVNDRLGPIDPIVPSPTEHPGVTRLVSCDKFVIDRHELRGRTLLGGDNRFHILVALEGPIAIKAADTQATLNRGDVRLLPATSQATAQSDAATLLDIYLP